MTEAVAADPILETDFIKEMTRQMRALDRLPVAADTTKVPT